MHVTLAQLLLTYALGVATLPVLAAGVLDQQPEDSANINKDKDKASEQQASPYGTRRAGWLRITRTPGNSGEADSTLGDLVTRGLTKWINARNSPASAESRDLYYVVLTGDTLVMYDGERMNECRGVIIMPKYKVCLHHAKGAGEAQVYARKTPIRLVPVDAGEPGLYARQLAEYYVYAERPVDKEDWYFALMWSSLAGVAEESSGDEAETEADAEVSAERQERLRRRLRRSCMVPDRAGIQAIQQTVLQRESHPSATAAVQPDEWLNAVLGRVFLAAYRTEWARQHLLRKMQSKFDRADRPAFLDRIVVTDLSLGDSVPVVTQPRLAAFDSSGQLDVSMFVHYRGGFRLALDTAVKLGGLRLSVSLAVVVQGLAGRMLVRFRPAPSNRFWAGFYEMPSIRLSVSPVFMQKQVRYAAVSQAIEKQIYDMVRSTLVLPNLDDTVFFPTTVAEGAVLETALREYYRAGLHQGNEEKRQSVSEEAPEENAGEQPRVRPFSMTDVDLAQEQHPQLQPAPKTRMPRHSHSRSTLGTMASEGSAETLQQPPKPQPKSDLLASAASLLKRAKDSQAAESAKTWWQSIQPGSTTGATAATGTGAGHASANHTAESTLSAPTVGPALPAAAPAPPAAVAGAGPRSGVVPASPTSPSSVLLPLPHIHAPDTNIDSSVSSGFHFPRLADSASAPAATGDALLTRRRPAALSQASEIELPLQRRYSKPK